MEGKEVVIMVKKHIRDRIDELYIYSPERVDELKKLLEWLNGLEV